MTRIFICIIILLFESCSFETLSYNRNDMEATILKNTKLQFKKKSKIEKNDIVIFNYYDKFVNDEMVNALRIVGVPGDTILILNSKIYVNGKLFITPGTERFGYRLKLKSNSDWKLIDNYSFRKIEDEFDRVYFLTENELREIKKLRIVDSILLYGSDSSYVSKNVVSNSLFNYFNASFFGPVVIPQKGTLITEDVIKISPMLDSPFLGQKLNEDLYFVMGDNFHWSYDSRIFGLLPSSKIRGAVIQN